MKNSVLIYKKDAAGMVLSYNWSDPADEDMLQMALVITKYVRFFDPAVVWAVAQDNRRQGKRWTGLLRDRGVDPRLYLWDGSPCCFPGVRRYRGGAEKAAYTNPQDAAGLTFPDAL
ncbi:MAG: hypothetical protein LBD29_06390, partial [Treponema sp.]|nr:hypothetical protein [Treponema sp.]